MGAGVDRDDSKAATSRGARVDEAQVSELLREDVLRIFRAGAIGAAIFAVVIGVVEFAWFGLEYWGSVATSTGTGAMAALFFWLSSRGKSVAASWVLIVGVWFMIMIDSALQAGSMTHGIVAMPLLVIVAVWLTGSARATYLLATASTLTLLSVELLLMNGIITPHGISSPFVGVMVIALILFLASYVSFSIYSSYSQRLREQQALTRSLAASEHDTRMIIDNSPDPYYRADRDGRIVLISPSITQVTGHSAEELIGRPLADFYADADRRAEFLEHLAAHNGEARNYEIDLVNKGGDVITVSVNARYWRGHNGELMGVEGNVRDVTELLELQQKLARAGRIEVLDQLSGGLAHNFNNLLAIIQGNAELLRLARDPSETERLVAVIEQASGRGAELTRRMMSFSSHAGEEGVAAVAVNEVIRGIKPILETSITGDIHFELDLEDDLWLAETHTGDLEDALINLVLNARDAVKGSGHITIRTSNATLPPDTPSANPGFTARQCITITVQDDGEGIADDLMDKVIEPFFTTKAKNEGTGLGLSMVYGFVRRTGGDLRLESNRSQGTSVTLLLPRATSVAASAPTTDPREAQPTSHERVLIVEDEAQLRELNEQRLKMMGYQTLTAESGVQARDILCTDEHIDLVFSDVVMPGGVSGFDLVHIVEQHRPGTPVLLCTGYAEEETDRDHAGIRILRKPFSSQDLEDAIREVLEAPAH